MGKSGAWGRGQGAPLGLGFSSAGRVSFRVLCPEISIQSVPPSPHFPDPLSLEMLLPAPSTEPPGLSFPIATGDSL